MTTFRVNIPLEVTVGAEVDPEEFERRLAQLLHGSWRGGPSPCLPAKNLLVSAKHLIREIVVLALAAKSKNSLAYTRGFAAAAGLDVSFLRTVEVLEVTKGDDD